MRARMEEQLVVSANARSHIMESVRAATTIKLMGREASEEVHGAIYNQCNQRYGLVGKISNQCKFFSIDHYWQKNRPVYII